MKMKASLFALACLFTSHAALAEELVVKAVSCASGKLNASGTLQVGSKQASELLKQVPADLGALVEAGSDSVFVAKVSGTNGDGGACYNDGKPTVLVIQLSK